MEGTPNENRIYSAPFTGGALTIVAAAGAVNGLALLDQTKYGRYLVFAITFPAMTSVTAFNMRVEGSNDNSTWTALKQNDGVTDLGWTGVNYLPAGLYVSKTVLGTIPIYRAHYKHYRLGNITCTGANCTISAMAEIQGLYSKAPIAAVQNSEVLLNSFLPTGS